MWSSSLSHADARHSSCCLIAFLRWYLSHMAPFPRADHIRSIPHERRCHLEEVSCAADVDKEELDVANELDEEADEVRVNSVTRFEPIISLHFPAAA